MEDKRPTVDWSLPKELWLKISNDLDMEDSLALANVNRQLRSIFKTKELLIIQAKKRWFSAGDQSIDKPDLGDLWEEFNVFEHCLRRVKIDQYLLQRLQDVTKMTDGLEIFDEMEDIIDHGDAFIPIALKLVDQYEELTLRYYAIQFLMARRHSVAFDTIDEYYEKINHQNDSSLNELPEDLVFKLCHLDPAFDKLLPHRNKVLNEVVKLVKQAELSKESPDYLRSMISLVHSSFIKTVKFHEYAFYDSEEDKSIMRLYAGETAGPTIYQIAIYQKILSLLEIKSELSPGFLIFPGNGQSNQKLYVQMLSLHDIEILTHDEFLGLLSSLHLDALQMNKISSPIQSDFLINAVLAPGETDSLRIQLMEGEVDMNRDEVYPSSRIELSPTFFTVAFHYWMHTPSDLQGIDSLITLTLPRMVFGDMPLTYILIRESSFFENPIDDLNMSIQDAFFYDFEKMNLCDDDSEGSLLEELNINIEFRLGDIVYDNEGTVGVICHAFYNKETSGPLYILYIGNDDFIGVDEVVLNKNPKESEMWMFLEDQKYMGPFFHRYDNKQKRFVPTERLLYESSLSYLED